MAFSLSDNDPFDPDAIDYAPETPRFEDVLEHALHQKALATRVCVPGKVIALSAHDQTVDVLPMFQTKFLGKDPQNMAPLRGIPVAMPQGQDFRLSYPLAVGDLGFCVIMDRNLDTYLQSDGNLPTDPEDSRTHDLNDSVFVPGLVPTSLQTTDTQTDLVLQNGALTLRLQKPGHIVIQNKMYEVIDLLVQAIGVQIDTLDALAKAQSLTAFGPAPFLTLTINQLTTLKQTAQSLQQNLQTFKGQAQDA
ncbi:MAG: hypothetical protein EOO40_02065 [Deltaproteobacteria bacterium]|nr:MAG: hypothetical protein EOO40_02065 [Deltaproteobacteria bacterium]